MADVNDVLDDFSKIQPIIHKVQYNWTINYYGFFKAKGNDLHSPVFASPSCTHCKWYLQCIPASGDPGDNMFAIVLNLSSVEGCDRVLFKFRISVLNGQGKQIISRSCSEASELLVLGQIRVRINYNSLDPNVFTSDFKDALTIHCEISFSLDNSEVLVVSGKSNSTPIPTNFPESDVCKDLILLLKNELFTDVVLQSANGKEYRAHKPILAARSTVFAAMFNNDMTEKNGNRVEISDIEGKVIEEMLNYIYSGKCENLDELASKLLFAADKYDLKALKTTCGNKLLQKLSVENALDILVVANLHHVDEFKSKVIDFIVSNSSHVMKTDAWKSFAASEPKLVVEICEALSRRFVD